MKLFKNLSNLLVVLGVAVAGASWSAQAFADTSSVFGNDKVVRKATAPDASDWLFVQTAKSLVSDGRTVTLNDMSPRTIAFSDRPERLSGMMSNEKFVSYWNKGADSFKSDPPNGTVTLVDAKGKSQVYVVELTNPVAKNNTSLTWTIKSLDGRTIPSTGVDVSLFIDWWYGPLGGVCHYGPWGGVRCW